MNRNLVLSASLLFTISFIGVVNSKVLEDYQKICKDLANSVTLKEKCDASQGCKWQAGVCVSSCEFTKNEKDCMKLDICQWCPAKNGMYAQCQLKGKCPA